MNARDAFQRTTCGCNGCKACCKAMPGMLTPDDVPRIMARFPELGVGASALFNASDGAAVVKNGQLLRIPTIVPRQRLDGRCIFLNDDETCQIHDIAPYGCSHFDVHMGSVEGNRRSSAGLQAIHQDAGDYQQLWQHLIDIGNIAPPLQERREKLSQLLDEAES